MRKLITLCALLSVVSMLVGCGRGPAPATNTTSQTSDSTDGHSHGGWWCDEHGVPEVICGLCDPKVAAGMKEKGDWCKEHDRPESQCFECHPEKEKEFAALYVAKYGKQPPKPGHDASHDGHDHGHDHDHDHDHEAHNHDKAERS